MARLGRAREEEVGTVVEGLLLLLLPVVPLEAGQLVLSRIP